MVRLTMEQFMWFAIGVPIVVYVLVVLIMERIKRK